MGDWNDNEETESWMIEWKWYKNETMIMNKCVNEKEDVKKT